MKSTMTSSWPWLVSIHSKSRFSSWSKSLCQGSLLTSNSIITVASCVASIKRGRLGVRFLGSSNHHQNSTDSTLEMFDIEKTIVHDEYVEGKMNKEYDLALLKLVNPVKFTPNLYPICLPITEVEHVNTFLSLGK